MKGLNKRVAFAVIFIILIVIIVSNIVLNPPLGSPEIAPPSSISVCQGGYDRDGAKIALVLLPVDRRLESTSFQILKVETNETVYMGDLAH